MNEDAPETPNKMILENLNQIKSKIMSEIKEKEIMIRLKDSGRKIIANPHNDDGQGKELMKLLY